MIENFNQLASAVMEYIATLALSKKVVDYYTACFSQLKVYLEDSRLSYSPTEAANWLHSLEGRISNSRFIFYTAAVNKLNDVYLNGEIRKRHDDPSKTIDGKLNDELRSIRKDFTEWISGKSDATVYNNSRVCSKILSDLQNAGVKSISELSYDSLIVEVSNVDKRQCGSKILYDSVLRKLVDFLYERELIPYGYTLLIDCLTKSRRYPAIRLSETEKDSLNTATNEQGAVSLNDYLLVSDEIYNEHVKEGYSQSKLVTLRTKLNLFYLFMDMNGLCYTPACGEKWLESIKPYIGEIDYKGYRRIAALIQTRAYKINFPLKDYFVFKETALSQLPSWCKPDVDKFLDVKRNEGWSTSTISMFNVCICRFCYFVDSQGINDFGSLTPADIKLFNEKDYHKTPASKNAYNSRIRKFLEYLGEEGRLQNRYLFLAVPSVCAKKESLVVVLSESEQKQLKDAFCGDKANISLREKAMLQLGFYMGLRSCDVVKLTIDDIDWENASINVLQDKTDYEIVLPMPTSVANALYRYIMCERPASDSREIFLRKYAPFCSVGRNSCRKALDNALPERKVPGSGFHVTRKTYATNLLRNNVEPQEITELLGHRDLANVHKYLFLDEERMKDCAISLSESGLSMKKGGPKHED